MTVLIVLGSIAFVVALMVMYVVWVDGGRCAHCFGLWGEKESRHDSYKCEYFVQERTCKKCGMIQRRVL